MEYILILNIYIFWYSFSGNFEWWSTYGADGTYQHVVANNTYNLDLKQAIITPIYKGGSRNLPKNYRPVALTSHLIKILEKILAKNIHQFLETHQKINPKQHGFRSGRSCFSQLLKHHNKILEKLQKSNNVDVIYLDFAKAFDKVDHGILLTN